MHERPPIAAAAIDGIIRDRRTVKVFADTPLDVAIDRAMVEELVAAAGWAPFHLLAAREHREGNALPSIVPWRCYLLDASACRSLRAWLLERGDPSTFPRLLAACGALVLLTWLPDPSAECLPAPQLFAGTRENMEHVAAASAAVQNLLLAATARGLRSFWATGGPLRTTDAFAHVGIPDRELLLGAVFLSPEGSSDAEEKVSSLRDRRGVAADWSRWVTLADGG